MKNSTPKTSFGFMPSLISEVVELPVMIAGKESRDYKAIVDSLTGTVFNIPKKSYVPVTNKQFTELAQEFAEVTGYEIDGFATWKKGAKVLAYLRKGGVKDKICGFDCQNHAVLSNSHDGRGALWVGFSNLLTRCRNQFGQILKMSDAQSTRLTHSKHSQGKLEAIKTAFAHHEKGVMAFSQACEALEAVKITKTTQKTMLKAIGVDMDSKTTRMRNIINEFEDCLKIEKHDLGANLFALFNAVTRYTTHVRPNKDAVYGKFHTTASKIDAKAFDYLKTLVGIKSIK